MSAHLLSIVDPLWLFAHPTQSHIAQAQTQTEELTGEVKKLQNEMVSSMRKRYHTVMKSVGSNCMPYCTAYSSSTSTFIFKYLKSFSSRSHLYFPSTFLQMHTKQLCSELPHLKKKSKFMEQLLVKLAEKHGIDLDPEVAEWQEEPEA